MMDYKHLKLWTMPDCYMGEVWPDYYSAGVGQSRDSSTLERSNFAAMLADLGGESETVIVVRESHWAVGWIEWIAIHATDDVALGVADRNVERMADYPVLDEDAWSELEWNEAADYWDSMTPRAKVREAMYERDRCHWLSDKPVWIYGRMDYGTLANHGSEIAESLAQRIRE
jgi:hypothetical protein